MTHERSQVENLESCRVSVPDDLRRQADLADFFEGWSYDMFLATYHAGELSEVDSNAAAEMGIPAEAIMARVGRWADGVGQTIMQSTGTLRERVTRLMDLHDPACTDEELLAKIREQLCD